MLLQNGFGRELLLLAFHLPDHDDIDIVVRKDKPACGLVSAAICVATARMPAGSCADMKLWPLPISLASRIGSPGKICRRTVEPFSSSSAFGRSERLM